MLGAVEAGAQFGVEAAALGGGEVGVGIEYLLGIVAGGLHDESVGGEVRNPEVESDAALLGTFHVARAAQFHVFLGHDKAVVGLRHHLEAVAGVLREFKPTMLIVEHDVRFQEKVATDIVEFN